MGMLDVLKDEHDKKETDRRFEKKTSLAPRYLSLYALKLSG